MTAAKYIADNYRQAFQNSAPRGRAWPRDLDTQQSALAAGLMMTPWRVDGAAQYLLQDAFPATANGLLPDWEETLGLPDSCYRDASPSIVDRQGQVVAKLAYSGGQSIGYFTQVAAAMGYSITVQEFAPFRMGFSRMGDPLYGTAWCYAWQVNGPSFTALRFRMGSVMGDTLASYGNDLLACKFSKLVPAHTILIFDFS